MAQEIKRMRYFNGLFLKEDEFNIERDYNLRMRRLHNHHLHGFGIVWGLIVGEGNPGEIVVSPGMAIDKSFDAQFSENTGREIVIVADRTVDLSSYGTADVYVWVSYNEDQADVVPELGGDEPIHLVENVTIGHSTTKPSNVEANLILAKVLLVGGNVDQILTEEGGESLRIPLVTPTVPTDPEPGPVVESQVSVTPWTEYAMVISATTTAPTKATTPTVDKAYWRRVGDSMEITYTYHSSTGTGQNAGTGTYLFSLPAGYAIDGTKINISTQGMTGVVGNFSHASSTDFLDGHCYVHDSTNLVAVVSDESSGANSFVSSTFAALVSSQARTYSLRATVPIANWTVGTVGSFNKVEYAYNSSTTNADDTTSFAYGESGALVPNISGATGTAYVRKRISLSKVFKHVRLEFQGSGSGIWCDSAGFAPFFYDQSSVGTNYLFGAKLEKVSETAWNVVFNAGFCRLDSTSGNTAWSTENTNGTRWRVVASDNPLFVEGDGTESQVSVTSWTEYPLNITATTSNPTKATSPAIDKAYWRRVGDSMEIEYTYYASSGTGAAAGSGNYLFSIPPGFTIDSSKTTISTTKGRGVCGDADIDGGFTGNAQAYNANNIALVVGRDESTWNFVSNSFPGSGLAGTPSYSVSFRATVPIAEWTTGTVGSFNRVEYAYNSSTTNANDTTSFSYGEFGSPVPVIAGSQKRKRVRFSKLFKHYELEFQENGIGPWLPAGSTRFGLIRRGDTDAGLDGAALLPVNTTDFDVIWTEEGCAAGDISTSTNTWSLENSNGTRWRVVASDNPLFVESGPESQVSVTSWLEYPLTISATTTPPTKATSPTIDKAYWRRVGDSMEISYTYRADSSTGASAGSGDYIFRLPPGYSIDTSKIVATNDVAGGIVGPAGAEIGGSNRFGGAMSVYDSTGLRMYVDIDNNTMVTVTSSNMHLANAGLRYSFRAVVPIAGWTTGTVGSFNRVEYAYNTSTTDANDTTSFAYGESGGLVPSAITVNRSKRVRFSRSFKHYRAEILKSGLGAWVGLGDEGGTYAEPGVRYGTNLTPVSSTDLDVTFYTGGTTTGSTWASMNAAGTRWRVVGCDNPLFVEAADPEFATATSSVFTPSVSGRYYALTGNSVTLTAGTWRLSGSADFNNGGSSPGYGFIRCSWHAANGDGSTTEPAALSTIQSGHYLSRLYVPTSSENALTATTLRLKLTTTSVIHLVPYAVMTTDAGVARITTHIYAERIS